MLIYFVVAVVSVTATLLMGVVANTVQLPAGLRASHRWALAALLVGIGAGFATYTTAISRPGRAQESLDKGELPSDPADLTDSPTSPTAVSTTEPSAPTETSNLASTPPPTTAPTNKRTTDNDPPPVETTPAETQEPTATEQQPDSATRLPTSYAGTWSGRDESDSTLPIGIEISLTKGAIGEVVGGSTYTAATEWTGTLRLIEVSEESVVLEEVLDWPSTGQSFILVSTRSDKVLDYARDRRTVRLTRQ
jgi:hypothetical protein